MFDNILTNEYAFTFLITFLSISIKGIAKKTEGISTVFKEEAYDFGPELVFISISFAVSKLSQYDISSPFVGVLKTIILHLFVLVFLIVILKRISSRPDGKTDLVKGLVIPLVLGFASLYLVLTYTMSING